MTAEQTVSLAYLTMAILNLAWQGTALKRLTAGSTGESRTTPFYKGLLRTARCRVGVATLYLGVGLNALYPRVEVVLVALGVHALTMAVWMIASWADLRLSRRLSATLRDDLPHRHRYRHRHRWREAGPRAA